MPPERRGPNARQERGRALPEEAIWPKLRSTNPLERVNREIGRRTDVVGIFPNDAALLRLAGMLLIEHNDEMLLCSVKPARPVVGPAVAA